MSDVKVTIDEAGLRRLAGDGIRDAFRKALRGKRCSLHGREVAVSLPDSQGAVRLTGCCDAFVEKASQVLN